MPFIVNGSNFDLGTAGLSSMVPAGQAIEIEPLTDDEIASINASEYLSYVESTEAKVFDHLWRPALDRNGNVIQEQEHAEEAVLAVEEGSN